MASVTSRGNKSSQQNRTNRVLSTSTSVTSKPAPALRTLTGVQILGTGSYVPDTIVRNEDLAEHGYDADWILQRTGIRERRRLEPDKATSDMALEAAKNAIEQSGVKTSDIDMVICGTFTGDTPTPSTACWVQDRLGLNAAAMDLNAACSGFVYSLVTGAQFVATGGSKCALIIGADTLSRILDPADKKTFPLFGDAAGAVVIGKGTDKQGLLSYTLAADGSGGPLLCVPGGGSREPSSPEMVAAKRQFLAMDGRPVFKWAVRTVSESLQQAIDGAGLTAKDIDLVVLHQANIRIIDAAVADLGFDPEKVLVNLDKYGNTSAGSIPLALDEAQREGRIKRGDNVLMCGFGAGLTWGTAVLKW